MAPLSPFLSESSHSEVPLWYINNRLAADVDWLLEKKRQWASATVLEGNLGNGNELVYYTGEVAGETHVIDIGWDPNPGGNSHGYVSVLGAASVDLRFGKDGIHVTAGSAFGGASFGMSDDGLVVSGQVLVYGVGVGGSVLVEGGNLTVSAHANDLIGFEVGTGGGHVTLGGKKYRW